jgi:hypothetical protein
MGRVRIQRRALELIFKSNRPKGQPRKRWFSQVEEDIWELRAGKKSERKNCGRKEKFETLFPHKTI